MLHQLVRRILPLLLEFFHWYEQVWWSRVQIDSWCPVAFVKSQSSCAKTVHERPSAKVCICSIRWKWGNTDGLCSNELQWNGVILVTVFQQQNNAFRWMQIWLKLIMTVLVNFSKMKGTCKNTCVSTNWMVSSPEVNGHVYMYWMEKWISYV